MTTLDLTLSDVSSSVLSQPQPPPLSIVSHEAASVPPPSILSGDGPAYAEHKYSSEMDLSDIRWASANAASHAASTSVVSASSWSLEIESPPPLMGRK